MDNLEVGSWIVNTTKHLNNFKSNSQELDCFQNTIFAGKTSMLMNKLIGSSQEIITKQKFNIFARESSIEPNNIEPHLKILRKYNLIDYSTDSLDRPKEIENYCFSSEKSIQVASEIFKEINEIDESNTDHINIEQANIDLLDATYKRPIKTSEVRDILQKEEKEIKILLDAHEIFGITKKNNDIIYNEYVFTGDCNKIVSAISNLKNSEKDSINEIIDIVSNQQGYLYEKLENNFDKNIINMMEGIGMLDGLEVRSDIGSAKFLTTPQLNGAGIGKFSLETDIFHSAKILLSCLRFGQEKSTVGRGKISTEEKMLNIIKKLNRGEWLNPCTAVGKDYNLLEKSGVVQVKATYDGRYQMRLRKIEVGRLVEEMIKYNKLISNSEIDSVILNNIDAKSIITPEERRNTILAKSNKVITDIQNNILYSLRD